MSKFSLDVLERCVFPFVQADDADIVLDAAFGEDVALTQVGDEILVSHVDPIVGAVGDIGWLAVHVACNDVAASDVQPRWIQLLVLVPRIEDEDLLAQIMRDASRAAKEFGASIVGGHTGGAQVGDRVLITKGIALEGTAILAQDFADVARELGLKESELKEGRQVMARVSVLPEALVLAAEGATAMHDVTRRGVLETLLEIAYLSGVRIEVELDGLPMPPIVSCFADAFSFDPLHDKCGIVQLVTRSRDGMTSPLQ